MSARVTRPLVAVALFLALAPAARAGPAPVPVAATAQRDLGPAPATARIGLTLVFRERNGAELDALLAAQATPGSPLFRHFLTPAQYVARYGTPAASVDRVARQLRARGFRIDARDLVAGTLDASAPVRDVEATFGTREHAVRVAGDVRYVDVVTPRLPPDLQDVETVEGLDQRDIVSPPRANADRAHAFVASQALAADGRGRLAFGPDGGYSPWETQQLYGNPYDLKLTGAGVGIAAIETDPPDDASLNGFLSYFGIKRTGPPTQTILIHGGCKGLFCGAYIVTLLLDMEQALGMAPGAAMTDIIMPNFSPRSFAGAFAAAVSATNVDVIEQHQYGCDDYTEPFAATRHFSREAAALGKTWFAVTPFAQCKHAPWPADAPAITGVSWTAIALDANGAIASETATGGASGGVSSAYALPAYQAHVPGVAGKGRNVPDLALPAEIAGSQASAYGGGWFGGSGLWGYAAFFTPGILAGLEADAVQRDGRRHGSLNGALYAHFLRAGYSDVFRDVTAGCSYGRCAAPGYDRVTGIGDLTSDRTLFDVL